ncbi:MAG: PCMD domain-containing protein [Muribaculaceae bacterium]|nr:PCMD domain-containing protein [Muribaculaceae bacterium]
MSYKSVKPYYTAFSLTLLLVSALLLAGCIKNDIPYPRIQPDITSITAEGLLSPAEIDQSSRMVVMRFDETVDMENVEITSYTLSEGASIVRGSLTEPLNLTKYYILTLHLYQDYDWVIQGIQNVTRYFTVENQIGPSVIDVTGRRVVVTLPETSGLDNVKVLTAKLGPEGSVITPAVEGESISLNRPLEVTVESFGRSEVWTIYGETAESNVATLRADAWTQVAWVYGTAIEGRDNGVEYRVKGETEWIKAPSDWVTHTGGTFYARLKNLNPLTTYEARTYSDSEYGAVETFTTGAIEQVPNSTLGEWNKVGKVWNPWPADGTPFWDTGNRGATTIGESNSTPTTDTSSGTGQAARLETVFAGIGVIGKLAAGNIFVGEYLRTDGTNGVLSFGRPFTQRPTRMRGYLKYNSALISHSNDEYRHLIGQPDTCSVYIALIDTPEPYEIRTNPKNRQLFDPNGSYVVAYGSFQSGESIPGYIPFEITLDYRATDRVPTYILIVGSASKYGDFFTGGAGSVLYLDDLELLYDY